MTEICRGCIYAGKDRICNACWVDYYWADDEVYSIRSNYDSKRLTFPIAECGEYRR